MMRGCFRAAQLLGLIVLIGSSAHGEMLFSSGRLQVGFNASYGWSMSSLLRDGIPFMNATSGNGTVIKVQDRGWAGSWHGNETVESVNFSVDGQQVTPSDGAFYSGTEAELVRTTMLAEAYRLTHTVHIEDGAIWETAQLVRVDPSAQVEVFYGWLGTRSNRLTDFATYNEEGNLLSTGRTAAGNSQQYNLPSTTKAVAQYDPQSRDGVTTSWQIASEIPRGAFIIDRPEDNKLYLAIDAGSLSSFSISQSMRFFDADAAHWTAAAAPEAWILGDMDSNGVVNNFDMESFELALADPNRFRELYPDVYDFAQRGDINGDGRFTNFDVQSFEQLLTSSDASGSAAAVPEPGSGLLAALAGLGACAALVAGRRAIATAA